MHVCLEGDYVWAELKHSLPAICSHCIIFCLPWWISNSDEMKLILSCGIHVSYVTQSCALRRLWKILHQSIGYSHMKCNLAYRVTEIMILQITAVHSLQPCDPVPALLFCNCYLQSVHGANFIPNWHFFSDEGPVLFEWTCEHIK
jgi:hypothetical protein